MKESYSIQFGGSILTKIVALILFLLPTSICKTQEQDNMGLYHVNRRSLSQAAERQRAAVMMSTADRGPATNFESTIDFFESVIDEDERTLVNKTEKWPYSAIGRIYVDCQTDKQPYPLVCTGTLIGARTVLTAAHCIVCEEQLTFAPGQYGNLLPFGISKVVSTQIPPEWFLLEDSMDAQRYDFAVLTLEKPLGFKAGWLSYGADCGTTSHTFKVAGYPADLDRSSRSLMYKAECKDVKMNACRRGTEPGMFNHKCDTFGGMSGAPLWIENENGVNEIRGIHTKGVDPNSSVKANSGVYISPETIEYITVVLS